MDDNDPQMRSTLEHIFPRYMFQTKEEWDHIDNVAVCCLKCNEKKGQMNNPYSFNPEGARYLRTVSNQPPGWKKPMPVEPPVQTYSMFNKHGIKRVVLGKELPIDRRTG
jgi:hypothetical protein